MPRKPPDSNETFDPTREKRPKPRKGSGNPSVNEKGAMTVVAEALLKEDSPDQISFVGDPVEPPEPTVILAVRENEMIQAEAQRREKSLEVVKNFLRDWKMGVGNPMQLYSLILEHHNDISSDPETNHQLFDRILDDETQSRYDLFMHASYVGLTCPDGLVYRLKQVVEGDYPFGLGTASIVESLEKLHGFKANFNKEERAQMFWSSRLGVDERISIDCKWDSDLHTYRIDAGGYSKTNLVTLLPPDRQLAEKIFGELQRIPEEDLFDSRGIKVRDMMDLILPKILNSDDEAITSMLNARNVKELARLGSMSTEQLDQLSGTREGQRRMALIGNYRRTVTDIDSKEEQFLKILRQQFQAGKVSSTEKQMQEEKIKSDHQRLRVEAEEDIDVALRQAFAERNTTMREMFDDGLLKIQLEKDVLRARVKEGQQDEVTERAFALAIDKQNKTFFAAKDEESPDETHARILSDIKKRIEDRFVSLEKSRSEGNLVKSEERQGRIGLGRLFEGLFQGENKEYLQELLADKEYVKSLLFQYINEEREDGLFVPVDSWNKDGQEWRVFALKELIDLNKKNFPGEKNIFLANMVDGIHQEIEGELLKIPKNNKETNYGSQNRETGRFDRFIGFTDKFGIDVSFDQLSNVTPQDIERINPAHELVSRDEIFLKDYFRLFQKTFGSERAKQVLMEVLLPELIDDPVRRDEIEQVQYVGLGEVFYSPKRIFGIAKKIGIDLHGARAMVKMLEQRVMEINVTGGFTRRPISEMRPGMNMAYQEEIEAILDAAGE